MDDRGSPSFARTAEEKKKRKKTSRQFVRVFRARSVFYTCTCAYACGSSTMHLIKNKWQYKSALFDINDRK
ncbi:hypothetical protein PUN28_015405 [Cardiocondyla obscurior]|uniref:Uncharacterized protein n=1 Tax=Cardiocondyla obscurior TaxID=286306 RepID=A0AAW2EWG2_9HYME